MQLWYLNMIWSFQVEQCRLKILKPRPPQLKPSDPYPGSEVQTAQHASRLSCLGRIHKKILSIHLMWEKFL